MSDWVLNRPLYINQQKQPPEVLCKGVPRNCEKFTGKHLCPSLFFNKVTGLRPATLFKTRLWHRCFPVNFAKFLRTLFLQNTSGRLLLQQCSAQCAVLAYSFRTEFKSMGWLLYDRKLSHERIREFQEYQRRIQNPVKHLR